MNKEELKIFEEYFFGSDDFKNHVESELGKPIKLTYDWNKRHIFVRGKKFGKVIMMKDILDIYPKYGEEQ